MQSKTQSNGIGNISAKQSFDLCFVLGLPIQNFIAAKIFNVIIAQLLSSYSRLHTKYKKISCYTILYIEFRNHYRSCRIILVMGLAVYCMS